MDTQDVQKVHWLQIVSFNEISWPKTICSTLQYCLIPTKYESLTVIIYWTDMIPWASYESFKFGQIWIHIHVNPCSEILSSVSC